MGLHQRYRLGYMVDECQSTPSTDEIATALSRVTLSYSAEEDRVCVDGITENGEIKRLWLTARIVNRLAPHLLRLNGDAPCEKHVVKGPVAQHLESPEKVEFVEGSEETLIESIDICDLESDIALLFKDKSTTVKASLSLSRGEMRRWTNALRHCYLLGGWPISSWQEVPDSLPIEKKGNSVTVH